MMPYELEHLPQIQEVFANQGRLIFGFARPPKAHSLPLILQNVGTSAGSSSTTLRELHGRV
jgi:hypothetical protein